MSNASSDTHATLPAVNNLLDAIPAQLPEELVEVLLQQGGMRLERIVSRGHCSPPGFWYEQAEQEWVLLVQGQAVLAFAGEGLDTDGKEAPERQVRLQAGEYLLLPAGCRHRVVATSGDPEAIWLALFYPSSGA